MSYDTLNMKVLSLVLNTSRSLLHFISYGNMFQSLGPVELNAELCARAVLPLMVGSLFKVVDLKLHPWSLITCSDRYSGAIPLIHLYIRTLTL